MGPLHRLQSSMINLLQLELFSPRALVASGNSYLVVLSMGYMGYICPSARNTCCFSLCFSLSGAFFALFRVCFLRGAPRVAFGPRHALWCSGHPVVLCFLELARTVFCTGQAQLLHTERLKRPTNQFIVETSH